MENLYEIDPWLAQELELLKEVPPRKPENIARGRVIFLKQAQAMVFPISVYEKRRHNNWMHAIRSKISIYRKERSPMFSALATIALIVSLVLGGGGATIAAAQSSLPDQPLYGVKLWSEDIRLGLATEPQSELQIMLDLMNRRAEEIQTQALAGSEISDAVQTRYQNQIEQAIRLAVGLPDDQAVLVLERVRQVMQEQKQTMIQTAMQSEPKVQAALLRIQEMTQERLQWVEQGLEDPLRLREQLRQREQFGNQDQQITPVTDQPAQTEETTSGRNPWVDGTPTPGSGYGPGNGDGDCLNCTPTGSGNGGNNPWTTGTPTPGSGYGPGPGPDATVTCTPGAGYGPGGKPTEAGSNQQENIPGEGGNGNGGGSDNGGGNGGGGSSGDGGGGGSNGGGGSGGGGKNK
jgi:hypothetical protein